MSSPESAKAVSVDIQDHVAFVEIHRPPHNYFDLAVLGELADTFDSLGPGSGARAIVLCAEGKNFCAGADLSQDAVLDNTKKLYAIAARLAAAPVPTVAAVQGAAVGGGFGLTLVTDFRVATSRTRFACNFAKLGFHHGFGISATLPPVVGQQKALEILYTAPDIRGEQAAEIGLVDRLADEEDLREVARELAAEIAASGPLAIASIRETMRGDLAEHILRATEREAEQQYVLRKTADFEEGKAAMAERRPPNFKGE